MRQLATHSNGNNLRPEAMVERVNMAIKAPPTIYHSGWIYGVWYCGTSFTPGRYYGQYPGNFIKRVGVMLQNAAVLHLCCGRAHVISWTNVDILPLPEVDVVADAEDLPFTTSTFDAVVIDPPYSEEDATRYGNHRLLSYKKVLAESHRVLRPGGYVFWLDEKYPEYARRNWKLLGLIAVITGFQRRTRVLCILKKEERCEKPLPLL